MKFSIGNISGDEFWLVFGVFPVPIEFVSVKNIQEKTIIFSDLILKKKESTIVSKDELQCIEYGSKNDSFTECALKNLPLHFKEFDINCVPAPWIGIKNYHFTPDCNEMNKTSVKDLK